MVNGVKSKKDAASTYTKMINIARNYESQAKNLMAKAKEVFNAHSIKQSQNRNNGKFASGFQTKETTHGGGGFGSELLNRAKEIAKRRGAYHNRVVTNLNGGGGFIGGVSESYLNEAISKAVDEAIDETIFSDLRHAFQGGINAYKTQKYTNSDPYNGYVNGSEAAHNAATSSGLDALYNKFHYKDAQSSGEKMQTMAKQYKEEAAKIRQMAKELAQRWGVSVVSAVGAKGPQKYGYGGYDLYGNPSNA